MSPVGSTVCRGRLAMIQENSIFKLDEIDYSNPKGKLSEDDALTRETSMEPAYAQLLCVRSSCT